MKFLRILAVIVLVAIVGVGAFAYVKLSNPSLPAAEPVQTVAQLDQGWSDEDRARYHFSPQGTLLLPMAWLQAMDQGFFTSAKLLDPANLNGLRQLTDGIAPGQPWNKPGLPIGWTVSSWAAPWDPTGPKVEKVGFNCSACHTGQLNYHGTAIRIEGAGAMQDAGTFQSMVGKAVLATYYLPWKYNRFLDAVSAATGQSHDAVAADLKYAAGVALTGARQELMKPLYEPEGFGRLDALQRIANTVFADDLHEPSNNHHGDGPVKFPYLWDIWHFDWVQYNASVRQPMIRNVGEALGVRAETNLVDHITGMPNADPARWNSSVNVENLKWMEDTLQKLQPPKWPENVLPKLDPKLASQGHDLFVKHCAGCHGIRLNPTPAQTEWVMTTIPVEKIGTAPEAAVNFINNTYSGAKLGQTHPLTAGDALSFVTEKIKLEAYENAKIPADQRPAYDGFGRVNEVRAPHPVYKARPLVGIWATPPYLHNGSVPTLFDLLSPDRPQTFSVGTRNYDPIKVGFETDSFSNSETYDTSKPGNSNQGHWFTNSTRAGKIGPELTVPDRMAIIEYLKSATHADYPCRDAATNAPADGEGCGK